jgi:hypothetical protein
MAIKVSGVTVIDDDSNGKFQVMNSGTVSSLPASGDVGDMVFDTVDKKLKAWTGSEWK